MENNIEKVNGLLDEEEILCQLAEEAAELGQAALKLRRALTMNNPTPVTEEEARDNLMEELADVSLCLKCLGITTDEPATALKLLQTMNRKAERWVKRLEGV